MVIDRIYELARSKPTKLALIHNNDTIINYMTFAATVERDRKLLERERLPPGTVAVVLVAHLVDAWLLVMALRALGLTTIQVSSLAQMQALRLKNVSCVVTTVLEKSRHGLDRNSVVGARLIVISEADLNLVARPAGDLPAPVGNHPYGGHIRYTSGTTGAFKKLFWDSDLEDARSLARSRYHGFSEDSVFHILAYNLRTGIGWKGALSVWQAGGCLIIDQRPTGRFDCFFNHAPTTAFMTPRPFRDFIASGVDPDPSSKCEFSVGGGVLGAELVDKAIARFSPRFSIHHSSGELITPVLSSRVRSLDDALWLSPLPDRTVQIVDENGQECLPGQQGDLRILTTKHDSQGYLDDSEATSRFFRDGFFYPGDLAVRREDGRIRVLGRAIGVLNIQGEKVAVEPIELRFQEYLKVDEVCLFSMLNDAGQDELGVAIQTDKDPAELDLDSIRREFPTFDKVRFMVRKEFPHAGSGSTEKVRRLELRRLLFSQLEDEY